MTQTAMMGLPNGMPKRQKWQPRNETLDADFLTKIIRSFDSGFLYSRVVTKTITFDGNLFVVFDLCSDEDTMTIRLAQLVQVSYFKVSKRNDLLPVDIGSRVMWEDKVYRLSKILEIDYWIKAAVIAPR